MIRFISFCVAFLVISFIGIPVYNGISKERENLIGSGPSDHVSEKAISIEGIYSLADNTKYHGHDSALMTNKSQEIDFPQNFTQREDPALPNTVK